MQSDKAAGTAGGKEWAIITQLALMYLLIVGVILAIPTFTIQAQQKVMYVDMQKIISQTNQGKDLAEKFQAHYAEAQRDLQNYENRIATMVKEYE